MKRVHIQEQSLPANHPHLASTHKNIGLLNEEMGNYSKACSSLERAVRIGLQSNHPNLRKYQKGLADVRKKL